MTPATSTFIDPTPLKLIGSQLGHLWLEKRGRYLTPICIMPVAYNLFEQNGIP